jgi:hypothetical protein
MQTYIRNFQRATAVATGVEERGYRGGFRDTANGYLYKKEITEDFAVDLLFTNKGDTLGQVGLLSGFRSVNRVMHSLGLFINDGITPCGEPETVVAVDLLWLRWNRNPERAVEYEHDYLFGTERGVQRFFEDLDEVGQDFVNAVAAPRAMADLLANLDEYPRRISWGGPPLSVRPHIYAAILYMQLGDNARAREVLDKGWREHQYPAPREYWQSVQRQEYQTRRLILLREIERVEGGGKS